MIYDELKCIWDNAYIPMVSDKACLKRIRKILESWSSKNCRQFKPNDPQLEAYNTMLNQLCDLAPAEEDLIQILKASRLSSWQEDYSFYKNMRCHPQLGCMTSPDNQLIKKQKRTKEGHLAESKRQERECMRLTAKKELIYSDDDEASNDDFEITDDSEYKPSTRQIAQLRQRPDSVLLELPTRTMAEASSILTARLRMSTNAVLTLFAKIIRMGQGELKDFVLSRTSVWRQRISGEKKAADDLYDKWKKLLEDPSIKVILQWDGKKVKYETGTVEDRLFIVLHTIPDGRSRFIGAPRTPDGTGAAQCEAIARYTDLWGVNDRVVGMIWDTTAANTGAKRGSGILYEDLIGNAILYIACRHHVYELHIHWADEKVRGITKGKRT